MTIVFLALRQMLARKRQTLLILIGICLGTMVYVVIAGLQFGMREYLTEQLLNNTAHVVISGNERSIDRDDLRARFFDADVFVRWIAEPAGKRDEARLTNPQGWFDRLSADPEVKNFSPRLNVNAIASRGSVRKSLAVTGIIPDRHAKVTKLGDYMRDGRLSDLRPGSSNLIMGSGVAEQMGVRVGQTVLLSTGLGESRPFRIVGLVHLGNDQVDKTLALMHLSDAQSLNRTPGRVSDINVALFDINQSLGKARELAGTSSDRVQSWQEVLAAFMQIIRIQDVTRMVITGAILLVSAFGIYNVLSIMITQKQKEIAILRSIGYGPERIMALFLLQGMALGLLGSLIGVTLGHFANVYIGTIDLGIRIGRGSSLMISYDPSIYAAAFLAAQASALVASLLPAWAASRLTPLDIIRSNL
jgi:lipoprotein-releasing system permease protein